MDWKKIYKLPFKYDDYNYVWADDGTMRKIYTHLAQKDIADRAKDFSNFFAKPNKDTQ